MTLRYEARVGELPFACDEPFDGLGTGATLMPSDLRLYLSDFRLVDESGGEVPFSLTSDGQFQSAEVVLLDFEAGCGDVGTPELHTDVHGTVPEGSPTEYAGVRFTLGVPEALNHNHPPAAEPPLTLTGMWWTWNAGYKFLRVEGHSSTFEGWRLHLGSMTCDGDMRGNASCEVLNEARVSLDGDPFAASIVFDLAALVMGSDLGNTDGTPPGCMSNADDPDCEPLFRNLGLSGQDQSVFRLD